MMCLCLSLSGNQLSQFTNYNYNSICKFHGKYYGASDSGIFELDTGDLDDTATIHAYFELPVSDWGVDNQKRIRSAHLGVESNGELLLTLTDDEGRSYPYTVTPNQVSHKQHGTKITAGRNNGKGRYWQLRVDNIDGADFSVNSISVYPVILNTRPARH